MRSLATSLLAIALGVAAAVVLVSCGSGDSANLLPGNTAKQITANLDKVAELSSAGDCTGAQGAAVQVSEQIDALGGVDKQLKHALRDGAARLNDAVAANCASTSVATTTDLTATTEASPSEKPKKEKPKKVETTPTTPTTTTPTVTTPTQTTPTTPGPPTTPSGPPNGGGTGPPSGGVGPGGSG